MVIRWKQKRWAWWNTAKVIFALILLSPGTRLHWLVMSRVRGKAVNQCYSASLIYRWTVFGWLLPWSSPFWQTKWSQHCSHFPQHICELSFSSTSAKKLKTERDWELLKKSFECDFLRFLQGHQLCVHLNRPRLNNINILSLYPVLSWKQLILMDPSIN